MFAVHSTKRWGMIGENSSIHNPPCCPLVRHLGRPIFLPWRKAGQLRAAGPYIGRRSTVKSATVTSDDDEEALDNDQRHSMDVMVQGSADLIESCHAVATIRPPAIFRLRSPHYSLITSSTVTSSSSSASIFRVIVASWLGRQLDG